MSRNNHRVPKDLKFNNKLGQHILLDEDIIARQIGYADIEKGDTVLEIGPGTGALTFPLAEAAEKVVAIEQDKQFYDYLRERIPDNVELILGDALKIELPKFDLCVSNLPYNISSPITFKLLEHDIRKAVLMYQEEFAQRMVANPGDGAYSRLSVMVYYLSRCSILENVPRTAFYPRPDVDSAIIELVPRKPPFTLESEELFTRVVNEFFSKRRKKIRNSVARLVERELRKRNAFSGAMQKEIIRSLPFRDERVETLSPEQIGQLSDILYRLLSKENRN